MAETFGVVITRQYIEHLPDKLVGIFIDRPYQQPAAQCIIDAAYEIDRLNIRQSPLDFDEALEIVETYVRENSESEHELLDKWHYILERLDKEVEA